MRAFKWMGLAVVALATGCGEDQVVQPNPLPQATVLKATGEFPALLRASGEIGTHR